MAQKPRLSAKSYPNAPPKDGDGNHAVVRIDGVSTVRVLVVEDYLPFRKYIASTLARTGDLQVICEVADGLEAIYKAEELKPDLILFDIGILTLNGIEAARQIRQLCPESKIIFVSQESDTDVVQEAFSLGALGYVVKASAATDLLAAIEVVRSGRLFVGPGLSSQYCGC
jgi:DNA-binding NarL/FixJ family response regulator